MARKTVASRELTLEKRTSGALFYSDKNAPPVAGGSPITSIYLRKDHMPNNEFPGTIFVVIETEEDA